MKAIAGGAQRGPILSLVLVVSSLVAVAYEALSDAHSSLDVVLLATVVVVMVLAHQVLLRWHGLIAALILVILFIPIQRYKLPASLPFDLEPYRIVVAIVILLWLTSLLIDPRVRLRSSGFEAPLFLFVVAAFGSVLVNDARIRSLGVQPEVVKSLTFLASFYLVFYMIVSVVRSSQAIDTLAKILVGGGCVLAVFGIVEARTGYNVFDHLQSVFPLLQFQGGPEHIRVGTGRLRVNGSAAHPIAYGAALAILVPIAVYLAQKLGRRRWWLATGLLLLGSLATISRTSVLMLVVMTFVYLWIRPLEVKRLVPALLPALLVVHLALPGTIGGLKYAFFPPGGLVSEQQRFGGRVSGRRLDPQFRLIAENPVFGTGYGTRITTGPKPNALILDDQWLGTTVETGLLGAFAWIWIFFRFIRRLGRAARQDLSAQGWLYGGIAASVAAFAVSMFTYDALSFLQVTFLLFILMAIGAAALPRPTTSKGLSTAARE
jgi:hypothetical protein